MNRYKINFHGKYSDDPDFIGKKYYTLMIATVYEVDSSNQNLLKRVQYNGQIYYPKFGNYMLLNYFKIFYRCCHILLLR